MAIKRMPIAQFVEKLEASLNRKDGYIMGSKGQNPRKWAKDSWWYTQYTTTKQREKALYWREHAERVWDCNGLAEGLYEDFAGVNINTKARYNYAQWCDPKGKGLIPAMYRVPGAAVFWGNNAGSIHHVAYLYRPVDATKPEGDWYIIEARGVMYGVVKTRLNNRKPNFWGWMTKYFDYGEASESGPETNVTLRNGDEGEAVRNLQTNLILLGYDCGKWGADGDFGDATEVALTEFQRDHGLTADGIYGEKSRIAMEDALAAQKAAENPKKVRIVGGNCYIRTAPTTSGQALGVAHEGDTLPYGGQTYDNGWHLVAYKNQNAWVSGKYSKLED